MNINDKLNLILTKLTDNQFFTNNKKHQILGWEHCIKKEKVFVSINGKGYKYKILSYDIVPCFQLSEKSGEANTRKYRLNEAHNTELNLALKNFYRQYCQLLNFPKKRIEYGGGTVAASFNIFALHGDFLAQHFQEILTEYILENRVLN